MAYSLPYTLVNATLADATQVQANFVALLAGLNNSFARDGSISAAGPINMAGYKVTAVGTPTAATDAATMGWVQGLGYQTAANVTASLGSYITTAIAAATYAPLTSAALVTPTINGFKPGYLDLVGSAQAVYTLVPADEGQTIFASGNQTIPANASVAFPVRTVVTYVNTTAAALTIAITTDTLTLHGTTTTGTRTLLANGIATIIKTGATTWLVTGDVS